MFGEEKKYEKEDSLQCQIPLSGRIIHTNSDSRTNGEGNGVVLIGGLRA